MHGEGIVTYEDGKKNKYLYENGFIIKTLIQNVGSKKQKKF